MQRIRAAAEIRDEIRQVTLGLYEESNAMRDVGIRRDSSYTCLLHQQLRLFPGRLGHPVGVLASVGSRPEIRARD